MTCEGRGQLSASGCWRWQPLAGLTKSEGLHEDLMRFAAGLAPTRKGSDRLGLWGCRLRQCRAQSIVKVRNWAGDVGSINGLRTLPHVEIAHICPDIAFGCFGLSDPSTSLTRISVQLLTEQGLSSGEMAARLKPRRRVLTHLPSKYGVAICWSIEGKAGCNAGVYIGYPRLADSIE